MTSNKRPPLDAEAPGKAQLVAQAPSKALQPQEPNAVPEHLRASRDRIYESMMRGGGEPFGAPFAAGLATLTQAVARKLKQKGFFAFETLERPHASGAEGTNKFTRYGAAPFRGDHARKRKPT